MKRKKSLNTSNGGHAGEMRLRQILADPNGNREQRRAAKKLGVAPPVKPSSEVDHG